MGRTEMFEKLKGVIVDQLGVDDALITEDASFIDDLGADSLDLLQLMTALEDEFSVTIPDEEFEAINTVGDVLDEISKLDIE